MAKPERLLFCLSLGGPDARNRCRAFDSKTAPKKAAVAVALNSGPQITGKPTSCCDDRPIEAPPPTAQYAMSFHYFCLVLLQL